MMTGPFKVISPLAIAMLAALLLHLPYALFVPQSLLGAPPQNVEDARSEIERVLGKIETVEMKSEYVTDAVIDELAFYRALGSVPGLEGAITATYSKFGWFRIEISSANEMTISQNLIGQPADRATVSRSQFEEAKSRLSDAWNSRGMLPPTQILVNGPDGLFQTRPDKGTGSNGTAFEKLVREHMQSGFIPANPIDDILVFLGWRSSAAYTALLADEANPPTLDWDTASVVGFELVGDAMAMRLKLEDDSEVFLDTRHGLAVCKRLWKFRGATVQELVAEKFQEVSADVFLPSQLTYTAFGHRDFHGENLHQKPMYTTRYHEASWAINIQDHVSAFRIEIPAGSIVVDNTILKVKPPAGSEDFDTPGRSNVAYVQPANKADLDSVVAVATEEAKDRNNLASVLPKPTFKLIVFFNLGLVILISIYFWFRGRKLHGK